VSISPESEKELEVNQSPVPEISLELVGNRSSNRRDHGPEITREGADEFSEITGRRFLVDFSVCDSPVIYFGY